MSCHRLTRNCRPMRPVVLIALVSLVWATRLTSQAPLLAAAPNSPVTVGAGSGTIILADVSGDGHLDMLTRHLLTRIIAVQFGTGDASFTPAPASQMSFAYRPGDMKLGDVNHDGVLDLAVTSSDRDIVDIFLGDGSGKFVPVPGSPFTVTTAMDRYNKRTLQLVDLNEDGHLDVVTANGRQRNTFAALLGDGRGGFSPGPTVTLDSGRDNYSFAFGDLDGDGHLDVVTASSEIGAADGPGRIVAQVGDGTGAYTRKSWSPLSVPPGPRTMAIADMNADHRPDLVMTHDNHLLTILLNAGDGMFMPAPASPFNLGAIAFALAVVDMNRDQESDLVAATANSVTVFLGRGRGRARTPAPGSPFHAGPGACNLAVGDLDEDGKLDVAASSFEGNSVTVLLGR